MKVINFMFALGLVLGLVIGLSHASPINETELMALNGTTFGDIAGILGDDPSLKRNDFAMVENWIGKTRSTVGNLRDGELYHAIYEQLEKACPDNSYNNNGGSCWHFDSDTFGFWTRCLKPNGNVGACFTRMWKVSMAYANPEVRRLLIGVAAGTVEALANNPNNCFDVSGERHCNIGDAVRVWFPTLKNYRWKGNFKSNQVTFMITNEESHGNWDCCASDSRKYGDGAVDKLASEIEPQFPDYNGGKFSRDTRCIINGDQVCKP